MGKDLTLIYIYIILPHKNKWAKNDKNDVFCPKKESIAI